jgi:hypothetical protein
MAAPTYCGVFGCGRAARYRFLSRTQVPDLRCRWHGLVYRPVCRRAIGVALVVGTILMVINQSDVLLSGHLTWLVAAKIGLTYLVPFSVSTFSALAANRLREN